MCVCCISLVVISIDIAFEKELENSAFLEVYFGLDSSCWFDTFLILFICKCFHGRTFGECNDWVET